MSKVIRSQIVGELIQDKDFDDWWESTPIEISFLEGKPLTVIFMDYNEEHDKDFIPEADEALRNFFNLTLHYKESISNHVYNHCMEFLNDVGYDEHDDHLWKIKNPVEIWNYIYPSKVYAERRNWGDNDIYIVVACECDWEQEHGLQLVFRQGKKLTRVSDQDGHVTEADAYGKPDSEDELLSRF